VTTAGMTPRQRELYDAAIAHGGMGPAARALGLKNTGSIHQAVTLAESAGLPPVPRASRRTVSSDEGAMPGTRLPGGRGVIREPLELVTTPPRPVERREATPEERHGFKPAEWTASHGLAVADSARQAVAQIERALEADDEPVAQATRSVESEVVGGPVTDLVPPLRLVRDLALREVARIEGEIDALELKLSEAKLVVEWCDGRLEVTS
jgi:hypothetical protein